ncbi:hypothetical protein KUTeg_011032 [Tegillarca granosa]|uniref:beta-N-acetylhexosaminidase n=1 Tax=Tegillarca granosa TaxID=220873 RepID=A0ABQ9F2R7_TEGGR|nr:hypothetical protein KUTeg_011032 [Tegillarca granosa]
MKEFYNNLQRLLFPLFRPFGHLEFVLKLERFVHLRELPNSPLSISPTTEEAYRVIFTMLEQVLATHVDSKYLHLGCDEVYGLGTGRSGHYMKEHGLDKEDLYLKHVVKMAKHVRSLRSDVTLIIWDDMLRHIAESKLRDSGIGEMVEPMIWTYVPNLGGVKAPAIWTKYGKVFKRAWAASSFKGATGPAQYITEAAYHIKNHISWDRAFEEICRWYKSNSSCQRHCI